MQSIPNHFTKMIYYVVVAMVIFSLEDIIPHFANKKKTEQS